MYNYWNNYKFRYPFAGCNNIQGSFSMSWQDIFILTVTKGKKQGTYLEIGAQYPIYCNNTYLLSNSFDWNGVSLEIVSSFQDNWAVERPNNKFICCDALTADYEKILLENYSSNTIDYLQVDIEPSDHTFAALKRIPLDKYRFAVITFETDFYVGGPGPAVREESRQLLRNAGYELIIGDVTIDNNPYEDWWVDLNLVDKNIALDIKSHSTFSQNPFDLLLV